MFTAQTCKHLSTCSQHWLQWSAANLEGALLESEAAVVLSRDQAKGLALACSSAVFIGSSFIIKKKGLRVAGTKGIRAGFEASDCCANHA